GHTGCAYPAGREKWTAAAAVGNRTGQCHAAWRCAAGSRTTRRRATGDKAEYGGAGQAGGCHGACQCAACSSGQARCRPGDKRARLTRGRWQARSATASACGDRSDRKREALDGAVAGEPRDVDTADPGRAPGTRARGSVAGAGLAARAGACGSSAGPCRSSASPGCGSAAAAGCPATSCCGFAAASGPGTGSARRAAATAGDAGATRSAATADGGAAKARGRATGSAGMSSRQVQTLREAREPVEFFTGS
ncbi:hypothetical protein, partial [Bradyrhizobium pachyrhizi]|uniref:hypothetical protein n=1 Tax=Bradyrhizobium pachyrhizi TaxID=280333 RepID=UPI003D315074